MPIYEYQCSECSENFEKLVFKSDEAVCCPKCSSSQVHRKMSVCGFKSGGDKGAASSRVASSSGSSCSGCTASSCASCH